MWKMINNLTITLCFIILFRIIFIRKFHDIAKIFNKKPIMENDCKKWRKRQLNELMC